MITFRHSGSVGCALVLSLGEEMPGRLDGKIAVVTGAGQGIGAAIARCFAAENAKVVVAEIDPETGAAVASELTGTRAEALFVQTDVADPASVAALHDTTRAAFGTPDILVNNAGINVFRRSPRNERSGLGSLHVG